jgi:hypothetical protein
MQSIEKLQDAHPNYTFFKNCLEELLKIPAPYLFSVFRMIEINVAVSSFPQMRASSLILDESCLDAFKANVHFLGTK